MAGTTKLLATEGNAMADHSPLPSFKSASWTITAFRESIVSVLSAETSCTALTLFLYAASPLGWAEVKATIVAWKKAKSGRSITAFIGTDHGLTDPDVLQTMADDGVAVWIPSDYTGIFHPKVVWLEGIKKNTFWIGSNNLTRDGLVNNIECATVIRSEAVPREMKSWRENIRAISEPMTPALLKSYRDERTKFSATRVTAGTFVWSRRSLKKSAPPVSAKPALLPTPTPSAPIFPPPAKGDLIMEIMPLETGTDGKQVQVPREAARTFFGLANTVGSNKVIDLAYIGGVNNRNLTLTVFGNHTTRLSLNELDYRDRPCVVRFHRITSTRFEYEIVQKSTFPKRYADHLALSNVMTRTGSRRWGMVI